MTLALGFETPLLLIGAAAAAIPFLLHLLSSVRAREVYFPTLRFLRISMEKTARRRRIQHWLLLLVRAALLALLAVAVAEPWTETVSGAGSGQHAAVLIIDNSLSMSARNNVPNLPAGALRPTRLEKAEADARALLEGGNKPVVAAVLFTNEPAGGPATPAEMTDDLEALVEHIVDQTDTATVEADVATAVRRAVGLLESHRRFDRQAIYIFSDLQKSSFRDLAALHDLARAKGVRLLFVSAVEGRTRNASVARLKITGRAVVGEPMHIEATLANSAPEEAKVTARLLIDGEAVAEKKAVLDPATETPGTAVVTFDHAPAGAGPLSGEVVIAGAEGEEADDLAADDRRHFSLRVRDRVRVAVVHGPPGRTDPPGYAPAAALLLALQPFTEPSGTWPIVLRPADGVPAERFGANDLAGMDAAFFCDVPAFTPEQADAVRAFARDGGTVVLFLGPNVQPDAYNRALLAPAGDDKALLPVRLRPALGQLELGAADRTLATLDITHRFFADLAPYKTPADYPPIVVRRYFPVELAGDAHVEVPMRHARTEAAPAGDPLLVAGVFGRGRVILCATTASPVWGNLFGSGAKVFMPAVFRMSLPVSRELGRDNVPGRDVEIRPYLSNPFEQAEVIVERPDGERTEAKRSGKENVFVLPRAMQLGTYKWEVSGAPPDEQGAAGAFVVNPQEAECDLQPIAAPALKRALAQHGVKDVYVGARLPADELVAVEAGPRRRDWWDLLLAFVVLLLVVEAVVANRFRRRDDEAIPAHLNPRVAR